MTANPKWPEIVNSLAHGQTVDDRPDLVARVFKMKMDELIEVQVNIINLILKCHLLNKKIFLRF